MTIILYQGTLIDTSWKTDILAALHHTEWRSDTTPTKMLSRTKSGHPILALEESLTEEDADHVSTVYGILLTPGTVAPVGLVETILLITEGDPSRIPRPIDELTNNGYWTTAPQHYDTAVLVDITLLPTRRGRGTFASTLLTATLEHLARDRHVKHVRTYTPNIAALKQWHSLHGAEDPQHPLVPGARPEYHCRDVYHMSYDRKLSELRILAVCA